MFAVVTPEKLHLPPGTLIKFPGTWHDYQALVEQYSCRGRFTNNNCLKPTILINLPSLTQRLQTILIVAN